MGRSGPSLTPMGPLPAHSSPCAFPASASPTWVPLNVNSVLFSLSFSFFPFISLCLYIMFPSFFCILSAVPSPFPSLYSSLPLTLSPIVPPFFPISFSLHFFFILLFNFFSFPFLSLSSSLLLLICSFFPSLCVLSAFVHHKTSPACSFCPLSIFCLSLPAALPETPALPQH